MAHTRLVALIRLFRIDLSISAGVCVVLGELLAHETVPPLSTLLLGFFAYFFISATALILNDYFDYETDRINAPERPLPSGVVSKGEVLALSTTVALLGLALSMFLNLQAFIVAAVVWSLGFLYNWRLKRFGIWGNLLVSLSVASAFVFGGVAVNNPRADLVWWFALLVFLFNLGEEIAADAFDIQGDLRAGSRSLAILYGQRIALRCSAGLYLAVILVSVIPFVLGWLRWLYFFPIAIMDCVILYSTAHLLYHESEKGRMYIRVMYLTGLASLVGFILIRTVVQLGSS